MSVGFGGILGSAAGAPLSQAHGSETERAQKDALGNQRQVETKEKAERAAGIGETQQDQESSDRDADGRRLWEFPANEDVKENPRPTDAGIPNKLSKDATGQSGTKLDLTG